MTMRIMFVGDINLGEYYTSFGHGPRTFLETGNVFSEVLNVFSEADIIVGNLEAPLTNANFSPNEPESAVLRGKPEAAEILYNSGFRVLQVANNHTMQHGSEGFDETVEALESNGIRAVGLKNQSITKINVNGTTVGFLAASDVPDNTIVEQNRYQTLDESFITKCKAAASEVDHLFVLLHWGLEASTIPMDYQIEIINELRKAGIRGVVGNHPHLFYEIWVEGNFISAPSLGNFIFDLCWDDRLLSTGILDLEFSNHTCKANVWPVRITKNGCLPVPSEPVPIIDKLSLYDLGTTMLGEQKRKLSYFFRYYFNGNKLLKFKFILRKVFPSMKPDRNLK